MLSRDENELLTRTGPGTPAPVLDPGGSVERSRARRAGQAGEAARRAPHRVSREERPARARGRVLPAPARLALLRPRRGSRDALRVSRLEVRNGRPLSR